MPSTYVNANVSTATLSTTARRAVNRKAGKKCCGPPDILPAATKPVCTVCRPPPYIFR